MHWSMLPVAFPPPGHIPLGFVTVPHPPAQRRRNLSSSRGLSITVLKYVVCKYRSDQYNITGNHVYTGAQMSAKGSCIELFHSRGLQQIYWSKGKRFNFHGIGLDHQHGRRFIVLEQKYCGRDVM